MAGKTKHDTLISWPRPRESVVLVVFFSVLVSLVNAHSDISGLLVYSCDIEQVCPSKPYFALS